MNGTDMEVEMCYVEEIEADAIDITASFVLLLLSIYILLARIWRKRKISS